MKMDEDITLVVEAINYLQLKNTGRYMENVSQHCQRMYSWDIETTETNIARAIETGHVVKKTCNSKFYLRVAPGNGVNNERDCLVFGSVKCPPDAEYVTMADFQVGFLNLFAS